MLYLCTSRSWDFARPKKSGNFWFKGDLINFWRRFDLCQIWQQRVLTKIEIFNFMQLFNQGGSHGSQICKNNCQLNLKSATPPQISWQHFDIFATKLLCIRHSAYHINILLFDTFSSSCSTADHPKIFSSFVASVTFFLWPLSLFSGLSCMSCFVLEVQGERREIVSKLLFVWYVNHKLSNVICLICNASFYSVITYETHRRWEKLY